MPPYRSRRGVLKSCASATALLASTGLSGCSLFDQSPPAGSVVFDNQMDLPEIVTLRVTSGPVDSTDPITVAGMSVALEEGEQRTVTEVLTESGTYEVEGWLLTKDPRTTKWRPEVAEVELRPEEGYSEYLLASIREEGGLLELYPTAVG